jgi:hypothetical protein
LYDSWCQKREIETIKGLRAQNPNMPLMLANGSLSPEGKQPSFNQYFVSNEMTLMQREAV